MCRTWPNHFFSGPGPPVFPCRPSFPLPITLQTIGLTQISLSFWIGCIPLDPMDLWESRFCKINLNWSFTTIGKIFSFLNHVFRHKDLKELSDNGWGKEGNKHLTLICIHCNKVTYPSFSWGLCLAQSTSPATLAWVASPTLSSTVWVKAFYFPGVLSSCLEGSFCPPSTATTSCQSLCCTFVCQWNQCHPWRWTGAWYTLCSGLL